MKGKIWKYHLQTSGRQSLSLPSGSTVLTVQVQNNTLVLWAVVPADSNMRYDSRTFHVVMTGEDMPTPWYAHHSLHYISTVQNNGIVAHIFEEV